MSRRCHDCRAPLGDAMAVMVWQGDGHGGVRRVPDRDQPEQHALRCMACEDKVQHPDRIRVGSRVRYGFRRGTVLRLDGTETLHDAWRTAVGRDGFCAVQRAPADRRGVALARMCEAREEDRDWLPGWDGTRWRVVGQAGGAG